MKKSNSSLSLSTLAVLLVGFIFASTNVAIAADEKAAVADSKEVATDADSKDATKHDADMKKKKKKAKDGEEEPECE